MGLSMVTNQKLKDKPLLLKTPHILYTGLRIILFFKRGRKLSDENNVRVAKSVKINKDKRFDGK